MACLAVADLPEGTQWEYELKFDGYRAIAFKTRVGVYPFGAMVTCDVPPVRREAQLARLRAAQKLTRL